VGVLQRFEQRLDRLVNGAFARAFRAEVQPVEIAAALQRELDDKAVVLDRDRRIAPNVFTVELGPADHDRLAPYAQALGAELADMVREHAQTQGYVLKGQVEVDLARDDALATGVFHVVSEGRTSIIAQPHASPVPPVPAPTPAPATAEGASVVPPAPSAAAEPVPHVRLVVNGTAVPITEDRMTLGRGTDVDLRVDDAGVSRRHAELRRDADGTVSVVDLASTNGTFVNDARVGQQALVDGDTIRVGETSMQVRIG
jgi:hypothetical protein